MTRNWLLALLLGSILTVGCEARSLSSPGERLHIVVPPSVTIGALGAGDLSELGKVIAATRLSNGHIAIADRGLYEIRVYDRTGHLVGRSGRRGEGPGDYRSVQRMWRWAADSLFVYDQILGRVSVLDARARFARVLPILSAAPALYIVGAFSDGTLLGEVRIGMPPHEDLGFLIGAHRASVTRAIRDLKRSGKVITDGRHLIIPN